MFKSKLDEKMDILNKNNELGTLIDDKMVNEIDHTPDLHLENNLNHWVDIGGLHKSPDGKTLTGYVTTLSNNEYTLAQWKNHLLSMSYNEFEENIIPTIQSVLKLLFYVEKGKEWLFPIDPLNMIISFDEKEQRLKTKAFFRYPTTLEHVNESWMEQIIKLVIYLCIPEVDNSTELFHEKKYDEFYNLFLYSDEEQVSIYIQELVKKYGQDIMGNLATIAYDIIFTEKPNNESVLNSNSVTELLKQVNGEFIINEVINDPEEYISLYKIPVRNGKSNLSIDDFELEDEEPEVDLSKMSKKERKQYEKEQRMKELQKRQEEKERQKQERKKGNKQTRKNEEKNPKKDVQNQEELVEESNLKKKRRKQTNKELILLFTSIFIVLGLGYVMFDKNKDNMKEISEKEHTINETMKKPRFKKEFYDGLLDSASNDNKAAVDNFDKYFENGGSMKDLNNSEIAAVFATYLENGQYSKILKNIGNEKTSNALVKYLLSEKKYDTIKNLPDDFKIIQLAKATINNNYDEMIKFKDVNLNDNQYLQNKLCFAFAKTNKIAEGKEWAESQNNSSECIEAIKSYAYKEHPKEKTKINNELGI